VIKAKQDIVKLKKTDRIESLKETFVKNMHESFEKFKEALLRGGTHCGR
jgi:hypothetical protein